MKLIVKGDSEEIKKVLKTNREYKKGCEISADEGLMRGMAQKYPDLFDLKDDPLAKPKEDKQGKKWKKDKEYKPSKNKMFSKGDSFKSKG